MLLARLRETLPTVKLPRRRSAARDSTLTKLTLPAVDTLARLEAEALQILWETRASLSPAGLMFSAGKDSAVVAHLVARAFAGAQPFPLIHYDSGSNFPEVLRYRDETASGYAARLISYSLPAVTRRKRGDAGRVGELLRLINQSVNDLDLRALIGGGRRDEDLVRAKERIFSLRDNQGGWNPHAQRPEPWGIYNTELSRGEHLRVFPLSNWTERNVWEYIAREQIQLPSIYFAHERLVVRRGNAWIAVSPDTKLRAHEDPVFRRVRCRTAGDRLTTGFIESSATNAAEILAELLESRVSERAGRVEDQGRGTDMESRKRLGWP